MSTYQTFRHYRISQDAKGAAVELWRSEHDIVCLAVDTLRQVFVELHVAITDPAHAVDLKTFSMMNQALGQTRSPHVIEVVDSGEDEGAMYAVTEFIDGERLDTYLARCNPVPIWLALQILSQLAAGLEALSGQPRLLANIELFNSAIQLLGDTPQDVCVKLADFRLAVTPAKDTALPERIVSRLVEDFGRLLAYMLTGSASEISLLPNALRQLNPAMGNLVAVLVDSKHPQHPLSFTDLGLLLENAVAEIPADQCAVPARMAPSLRPRLPLQVHLASGESISTSLAAEFTASNTSYDAAAPYQLPAATHEHRHPATIHLLPPDRLMPRDFTRAIRSTQQRVNALDHPHLLRVLKFCEDEGQECLVEEASGRITLADLYHLKRPCSPSDAVIVLEQLNEAAREAEGCGLTPVIRSLRQIYVQLRPAPGQTPLTEKQLAATPMEDWPPFYLRVRTYPTTLNLTQPGRFVLERQVGELPAGSDEGSFGKLSSLLTAANARDFALITHWLTAGHPSHGEKMRHLLLDYLVPKKGRAAPMKATEFLDRLSVLVGRSATRKPPQQPKKPSRANKLAIEEAAEAAQSATFAEEAMPAPAFGEMITSKLPQTPHKQAANTPARAFGSQGQPTTPRNQPQAPVGFAEALFGTHQPEDDDDRQAQPPQPTGGIFGAPAHHDFDADEPNILQGLPTRRNADSAIDPRLLMDDPEVKPRWWTLLLWVIVISALVAFVLAHFVFKTAFWLKK